MLGCGIGVTQLLGDLDRIVDDLDECLGGCCHGHGRARGLRHLRDGIIQILRKPDRVCANALDDGRYVVLICIQQGLQKMYRLDHRRIGICGNAHGVLHSLLRRDSQLIKPHIVSFQVSLCKESHCLRGVREPVEHWRQIGHAHERIHWRVRVELAHATRQSLIALVQAVQLVSGIVKLVLQV